MFEIGKLYSRSEIHAQFGGQKQGGISTPAAHPLIFLFTGKRGEEYGYKDGWTEEGIFYYTGEGQQGDMDFIRGNKAVRDHLKNCKELHLFESLGQGKVRYQGNFSCIGYHEEQIPDRKGKNRRAIIFELVPEEYRVPVEIQSIKNTMRALPIEELRRRAIESSSPESSPVERKNKYYLRSEAIALYAKRRANGYCEGCGAMAPFTTENGDPYLEVHHITWLSDNGPDDPSNVVALCPNCHRRAHFAVDREKFNRRLKEIADLRESSS
jgi:5-methylcytosine-specific restriction protein A|uniref:HNH endonuclease n=1 Tax=candidate division WOR-3 bacterium TaxID=2052148 RepID=A0A7V3KNX3_UNCW3